MKKFEYKILSHMRHEGQLGWHDDKHNTFLSRDLSGALTELGNIGWEMCGAPVSPYNSHGYIVLKREKIEW